jgi:hypothetical protein
MFSDHDWCRIRLTHTQTLWTSSEAEPAAEAAAPEAAKEPAADAPAPAAAEETKAAE